MGCSGSGSSTRSTVRSISSSEPAARVAHGLRAHAATVADGPERRARRDHRDEPVRDRRSFIILLAARQSVPDDLYELAALEDATWWDVFRRVTLPLLSPLLVLLFLRDTILSFQWNFVPALVVTDGGRRRTRRRTSRCSSTAKGFEYLRYGYAAAAPW